MDVSLCHVPSAIAHLAELCSLGEELFVLRTTASTDVILLVQLCQCAFDKRENRALVAWKQVVY